LINCTSNQAGFTLKRISVQIDRRFLIIQKIPELPRLVLASLFGWYSWCTRRCVRRECTLDLDGGSCRYRPHAVLDVDAKADLRERPGYDASDDHH